MIRATTILAAALVVLAATVRAQEPATGWGRLLPHVHYFDRLLADPLEPRLGLGLQQTDLFKRAPAGAERPPFTLPDPENAASDVEASAVIGGSIPLWHLKEWPGKGGIVITAQAAVFARFRIEYPTREDVGQDWLVGMPIEFAYNRFSGRFRIMHRSAHIGDELVEITGAERIEFGGEYADFIAAYEIANETRVYGGATYNFRSYTERLPALRLRGWHDHAQFQAGTDGGWYPWSKGRIGLVAGFDWQTTQRTNWRSMFAGAGGIAVRTPTRASRVLLRYFHGPSTVGEFFLTPETVWGIEWVIDF